MRVLPNVYSCFVCLNVCRFFIRETCTLLNQPPTSTVCWTNKRASKEKTESQISKLPVFGYTSFSLSVSSFVCVYVYVAALNDVEYNLRKCPADAEVWLHHKIHSSKISFDDRIHNVSTSDFLFSLFFLCRFYHSYTHLCVRYDYEIVNGWTKEEAKTKIKRNPMNMSSKVKRKNLEPTTEKKEKEKLWIIKNSVKSPIELTLTANAKKSWRKLNGKYIVTSDGKNLRVGWTFCCCFFVVGKGKVCI